MARVLVSGLINIETTLRVDRFPLDYFPVTYPFGGVASRISGVGLNVARALQVLGHEVTLAAMIGRDPAGRWVRDQLARWHLDDTLVLDTLDATPQSVILHEPSGRRQIHVDLKNIQESTYPADRLASRWPSFDLAVLANVNYNRALLPVAQANYVPIATDVHVLRDPDDAYNRDFMAAANLLFFSHEQLPASPEQTVADLRARYPAKVIVAGLGAEGALLAHDGHAPTRLPAVTLRPIANTVGAGDALFSSFLHGWLHQHPPAKALRHALVFAGWKIGETAASEGFLTAVELAEKALELGIE